MEREFEADLKPREIQTMQVGLQPEIYEAYCPVGNHEGQGMTQSLTVI